MLTSPSNDCPNCPRLCEYRQQNRVKLPGGHHAPVPSFGELSAKMLIVGLAPGLKGANYTGWPFTGDYAGEILYGALLEHGLATGHYAPGKAEDSLKLHDVRITNSVRCAPPENKPTPQEISICNPFLKAEIAAMPHLKLILTLGGISFNATLRAMGEKPSAYAFSHGKTVAIGNITLLSSYHTSRYNIQTKRLTPAMFSEVIARAKCFL